MSRTRRRGVRWGGDIEVMRRGDVAERVIGTACAAQDCGSREANTSLSGSSRVRMGEWSSVNKCTFLYIPCIA